jgi:hypothetical protein
MLVRMGDAVRQAGGRQLACRMRRHVCGWRRGARLRRGALMANARPCCPHWRPASTGLTLQQCEGVFVTPCAAAGGRGVPRSLMRPLRQVSAPAKHVCHRIAFLNAHTLNASKAHTQPHMRVCFAATATMPRYALSARRGSSCRAACSCCWVARCWRRAQQQAQHRRAWTSTQAT